MGCMPLLLEELYSILYSITFSITQSAGEPIIRGHYTVPDSQQSETRTKRVRIQTADRTKSHAKEQPFPASLICFMEMIRLLN